MIYGIQNDGTGSLSLNNTIQFTSTDEYIIDLRFKLFSDASNDILKLLDGGTGNDFYYRQSRQALTWRFAGSTRELGGITLADLSTDFVDVALTKQAAGGQTISFGTSSTTFGSNRSFKFSTLLNGFQGVLEYIKIYSDLNRSNLIYNYSPSDSDTSNTGLQPVVAETVTGNNANGNNFPTNGDAWVTIGGSPAIVVDLPLVESANVVYTPAINVEPLIELPLVNSEAEVFACDVLVEPKIGLPTVLGEAEVFEPRIYNSVSDIELSVVLSETTVFEPTINVPIVISPDLVEGESTVYNHFIYTEGDTNVTVDYSGIYTGGYSGVYGYENVE